MTDSQRRKSVPARPVWMRFAGWFTRRSRLVRIVVAALFGFSVTMLVSPVVDSFYLRYLFSPDTRVVPSLVSTTAGVIMYILGWRLTLSAEVAVSPPLREIAWYLLVGSAAFSLVVVLLVGGVVTGTAPT